MSYLQDKKTRKKKTYSIVFGVLFFLILIYFRSSIFSALSCVSSTTLRPVFVAGNSVGGKLGGFFSYFSSKKSLSEENENLKSELAQRDAEMSNYHPTVAENISFKEALGRKTENQNLLLSAILAKPNRSPYDTLIIDVGSSNNQNKNIAVGNLVFALGNVPIGRVGEVNPFSSKVILFTNPGEKTEVVIASDGAFISVVGRGGGNFEMIVPRDFIISKGDTVVLPGITPYVLGVVETILSDPRDSFTKALLASPVNIQELKFVEVEI